jgi:hypothetical protein
MEGKPRDMKALRDKILIIWHKYGAYGMPISQQGNNHVESQIFPCPLLNPLRPYFQTTGIRCTKWIPQDQQSS